MLLKSTLYTALAGAVLTVLVGLITGHWVASLVGGGAGLIGAFVGLVMVHRALPKGQNGVLGAVVMAMLLRMVLLGVGLGLTIAVFALEPLVFVGAFFAVYVAGQVLEILHVHRAGRARHAMAS